MKSRLDARFRILYAAVGQLIPADLRAGLPDDCVVRGRVMGAHRYCYFTAYRADIDAALQALRQAEFKAGHYAQAMEQADPPIYMFELDFPPDANSPAPGPVHASIQAALDDATEEGTGSILDLLRVTDRPEMCSASPVGADDLRMLFGTVAPSRAQVESVFLRGQATGNPEAAMGFMNAVERGQGRYIIVHDGAGPSEIFFFGYALD